MVAISIHGQGTTMGRRTGRPKQTRSDGTHIAFLEIFGLEKKQPNVTFTTFQKKELGRNMAERLPVRRNDLTDGEFVECLAAHWLAKRRWVPSVARPWNSVFFRMK